jgi:TolA-binding protein
MNRVDDYFSYVNGLGDFARVSMSEQDSLTYTSAEKIYMEEDCSSAIEFFRKYLQKFPNGSFTVNAHFYLADCYQRQGKPHQALDHYEKVIERPTNTFSEQALTGAARINLQNENYEASLDQLKQLERIADVHHNLVFSRVGRMRAAFELERYDLAFEMAEKVLHTEKVSEQDERNAHYIKAKILFHREQYDAARDEFRIIAGEANSSEGAEAQYRIAQIYFKNDEYKVAENEIFDFIQQNSSQEYWKAKSFILLAEVYQAMGDLFQARHTLKSILENYQPTGPDDNVLEIARKKYENLAQQEQKQMKSDTAEDKMEIRLDQNVPDTTGRKGPKPDQPDESDQNNGHDEP